VQLTRDGQLVVIHDPTLDRTTTGRGPVASHDLEEIRALSAGYPKLFGDRYLDEKVPTLEEAFELLRGHARVLIEIKPESVSDEDDGIESRVVRAVRQAKMTEHVGIASFLPRALLRCRRIAPELPRAVLFAPNVDTDMVAIGLDIEADLVLPHRSMLDAALAGAIRGAGLRLGTWIVDDPDDLDSLVHFGLAGVGTNDPGRLLAHLDGLG
jgi:glycerophosphoryl diester phosphodiesterase